MIPTRYLSHVKEKSSNPIREVDCMGFLPYFVLLIHVFSFPASVVRGTQRLLSVKYLFGEANVA